MSDRFDTRVIQVTNIAPSGSNEQIKTLFSFLGRVKEIKVYPPENTEATVARVAYLEFDDAVTTGVALHLNGTVLIDRALMVVPVMDGKLPEENVALQLTPQAVSGVVPGQPTWPASVVHSVAGTPPNQMIVTHDPRLTALGLPPYPPLPVTTETSKIEEIRRTVYLSDLDLKVTPEMLLAFFCQVGEVKYIRMAGNLAAGTKAGYIEFSDQRCVAQALKYSNVNFHGAPLNIQHAKTTIIKPPKPDEDAEKELGETMKKVKEASKLVGSGDRESSKSPGRKGSRSKSKGRSRSPSKRSRSRSKGHRRRTRSRSRRRSRSRHRSPRRSRTPVRRRRSRSRGKVIPPPNLRRSRSRDRPRRSRTRSPVRRRRSRSGSRPRRRSRTPAKSYGRRPDSRRKSRSRSRRRSRDRKDKEKKERKKSASLSPPALERDGSLPPKEAEDRDSSPGKADSRSPSPVKKRSPSPVKKRSPSPVKKRKSPSPKRRSRSKSPSRRKRRRKSKSPSPRRRSRSRSGSRHRNKRERSRRSRSRDRKHDSKKKSSRDKDDKRNKEKDSGPPKPPKQRDYDEEEKGFASGSEKGEKGREPSEARSDRSQSPPTLQAEQSIEKKRSNSESYQAVDMDMSD